MPISLSRGGNVSLTKEAPTLQAVVVGVGWDVSGFGADADLDASALVLGQDERVLSDQHFVFFNNRQTPDGQVQHSGDNLTGEGGGDDEQIRVNLAQLPPNVAKVVVAVSIHEAQARGQSFGGVQNAYMRIVDAGNDTEIARYDLSTNAATETAMVFGEVYRNGQEWKFRAVGQGWASGLGGIASDYGVSL